MDVSADWREGQAPPLRTRDRASAHFGGPPSNARRYGRGTAGIARRRSASCTLSARDAGADETHHAEAHHSELRTPNFELRIPNYSRPLLSPRSSVFCSSPMRLLSTAFWIVLLWIQGSSRRSFMRGRVLSHCLARAVAKYQARIMFT